YTVPGHNRPGAADSVVILDEDGSVASFEIEPEFLNAKAKARRGFGDPEVHVNEASMICLRDEPLPSGSPYRIVTLVFRKLRNRAGSAVVVTASFTTKAHARNFVTGASRADGD
ncbi:unnamed protein product, partial [Clonostachys rhizophaga]